MKVEKTINIQGDWAKAKEDIFNEHIIRINDGGAIMEGTFGDRKVFKIETPKNGEKILSFNQTTINYLIDAFGDETEKWIGNEVKVRIVKSNVAGKMRDVIYLTAPDWVENEYGFAPPTVEIDNES